METKKYLIGVIVEKGISLYTEMTVNSISVKAAIAFVKEHNKNLYLASMIVSPYDVRIVSVREITDNMLSLKNLLHEETNAD